MSIYYMMSGKHMRQGASAYFPFGSQPIYELIDELTLSEKSPYELKLVKLSFRKGEMEVSSDLSGIDHLWTDYLSNNLYGPLLSARLRTIIDKNLTGNEGLKWIDVVVDGCDEKRTYYIPKFTKVLDVLNEAETSYYGHDGRIAIPAFSANKINHYSVFYNPSNYKIPQIPSCLYVNSNIKNTIIENNVLGVTFEKISVL